MTESAESSATAGQLEGIHKDIEDQIADKPLPQIQAISPSQPAALIADPIQESYFEYGQKRTRLDENVGLMEKSKVYTAHPPAFCDAARVQNPHNTKKE